MTQTLDCPGRPPTITDTAAALTDVLFAGRVEDVHVPWRSLFDAEPFHGPAGDTPEERIETSYRRLRAVNEALDCADDLAGDTERVAAMLEWATPVDGGLAILASIHYGLFLGSLRDHDPDERRDRDEFLAMRQIGTFLCTELGHGNDVVRLETTATRTRDGFVLHTPGRAAQKFMPNTSAIGGAKAGLVAARLIEADKDLGIFLFLTPLCDDRGPLPGVTVRRVPGYANGRVDHCLTAFDRVRLPPEALLTSAGTSPESGASRRTRFLRAIDRVTPGKLYMCSSSLGGARTALAIAVRYAHTRHTTGLSLDGRVPLVAHCSHQARLLNALADTYAATLLMRSVVSTWTLDPAVTKRTIGMVKPWITWLVRGVVTECRERCGAQGLVSINGLVDFTDLIEGAITAEGDNLPVWVKAAGELLDRQPTTWETPGGLDDPDSVQSLLCDVERIWQDRAQDRSRRRHGSSRLDRWNPATSSGLEAVDAHVGQLAGRALLTAASAVHQQARRLLLGLHRLFALRRLAPHTGDLLAEGRITADHVRELPAAIEAALTDLAPHALTLVDAFMVSGRVLDKSPIASSDYIAAFDHALTHNPIEKRRHQCPTCSTKS